MGKIFSTITDAVGLTNTSAERKAANAAAAASDNANALAADNLEFQKEQYNDWKAIYGSVQDNLGEYYKTIGADKIAAMGLEAQQREYQNTVTQIKQENAQKGLDKTPFEQAQLNNLNMQNATARASIRANAQDQANQQKLNFLGIGLGQGSAMLGNVNSASSTGVNAFTNQSNTLMGRSNQLNNTNSAMLRALVNEAGSAAGIKMKQ